jgi:hypothetical protein
MWAVFQGALKEKKNERPPTLAESIQKAPTHLLFFLFFYFQAFLSKWS